MPAVCGGRVGGMGMLVGEPVTTGSAGAGAWAWAGATGGSHSSAASCGRLAGAGAAGTGVDVGAGAAGLADGRITVRSSSSEEPSGGRWEKGSLIVAQTAW